MSTLPLGALLSTINATPLLDRVDWVNGFILPILMWILLGIPLAIYTGVMISRWVAFDTAKMKAAEILTRLAHLPGAADRKSYDALANKTVSDLLMVKAEMIRLRQVPGVHITQFVSIRLQQQPWLPQTDGKPDVPSFPLVDVTWHALLARIQPYGMAYPQMIFDTAPSLWDLFAIRRRVTSKQIIPSCDFQRLLKVESAAIDQFGRDMNARELALQELRRAQEKQGDS